MSIDAPWDRLPACLLCTGFPRSQAPAWDRISPKFCFARMPTSSLSQGNPAVALHVWVTQEHEDHSPRHATLVTSCCSATQTLKAASGPPREGE